MNAGVAPGRYDSPDEEVPMSTQPPYPPGGAPPPPGPPPAVPGYPGYGYPYPPQRRTNTMAILALVLALVFAPVGIILGHIARKQIRETGEDGDGLALAGLIIGYVLTGITVVGCLGYVIFVVAIFGSIAATSAGMVGV